jgi:nucleoprotein TPR
LSHVPILQEKFQAKIHDLQKARAADAERAAAQQEASVKAATESVMAQLQSSNASSSSEELSKRHAEEMRALQERLSKKYQEDQKAAVDAAVAAVQIGQPSGASPSESGQSAAIAAAVAAREKELQALHAEEIASAVDRGRMEQATKGKLKDAQLVKSQKRVKELEAQILEWRNAGHIPGSPVVATPSPTAPIKPATSNTPSTSVALPRKPSIVAGTAPVEGAGRGVRGGVRGVVRGAARGLNIRGAAPGRGGAPPGSTSITTSAPTGQVSFIGAASKRSREEGEPADDSLVKRLKPAEGGSGPVPLRRPQPS